ncbi:MAG: tRNA (N6-isopentenyl adenosine(37)-C2)-methylthiotransferase MiaB, partial [Actinobacteria bacterium]|nr:tRNA (N6-isopentenyl adenosine(37)-C2)-methylthiotransferase MiaB [Actinomycetota bacterium]NIV57488.1 tRNA (N6-isopentenyl adenosine(37)-C2)-methylthiotransferase MiaB [Actinomycetota bacterium]NIV89012.1 tRNA (N6-isopentenyl adenosine(37)-C2)-methylthiotransferase MiaB [Actinomycetota bacterium]NIW30810.1 tRNA (N6-isopentenyl adenosine(37)-C2)-methylthiotransferase MiaB [Actinomycetota bacterium]
EPLLDAMVANPPVVVPHLHLPLQSGSDAVLRRMNRQYRVGDYLEMIDRVNAALTTADGLPPAITTDIICG